MGEKIIYENQEITKEELEEKKKNLQPGQRIVESSPNNFHLLERMQE